ncbi:hypothetical protein DUI87_10852 [Hirundo rustica rustica]|uniref:Uncharacterized protein n=1 Tax=Hirundo rustica rustica TaxID=333673 RepID=A0A3M0L1Z3_HIRRU|nr:hypothetical protein DUI87_10852 [Hirundo rustica rustica]
MTGWTHIWPRLSPSATSGSTSGITDRKEERKLCIFRQREDFDELKAQEVKTVQHTPLGNKASMVYLKVLHKRFALVATIQMFRKYSLF